MTGICGAIGLDGRPYEARDTDRMLAALARLGPDGGGTWAGPAGRVGVALGVALRCRVPEDRADRQPVRTPDGMLVAVADVVLDNRGDLARRLGEADRPDLPDSRLLLAAYQRWGVGCLSQLLGEFAIAVVDRRRGGVLLARDHVGVRPLHVHTRAGTVAFASTALALTGFAGVGHELDVGRLAEYLAGVLPTERSWVTGVRPLAPGSALWIDDRGPHRWRYWQLDPDRIAADVPAAEHVERLRTTFDLAVRARLRRTGAVGVALSGGLDSTSVAATAAAALSPAPVHTYTSVPPPGWSGGVPNGLEPDESHLVADLARRYPNLRPRYVDARGAAFFSGYDELFELGGTPPRNACNMTWLRAIYQHAVADGVSTFLTGASGNYFFSADDPSWLAELLRRGRLGGAVRELRAWTATGRPLWPVLRGSVARELAPAAVVRWYRAVPRPGSGGRVSATDRWFADSALRPELRDHVDVAAVAAALTDRPRMGRVRAVSGIAVRAAQAESVAAFDAGHGLRGADPTMDVRVVEASAAQPAWVRRHDGHFRAACRAAMADRLPDSIRLRTARGLQLPDWLDRMTDARAELAAELGATKDDPVASRFVDVDGLDSALRNWPARSASAAPELVSRYRIAMLRALLAGRYVRWFGERADREAHGTRANVSPIVHRT